MKASTQSSAAFQFEIPNYGANDDSIISLPNRGVRARVNHPNSRWIRDLADRFNELTSLTVGWDGYTGQPISFSCAQFAANLIECLFVDSVPEPQLVPGSDGTLQLEWHLNQFDLEIDVLAPYRVVASRFDHLSGKEEEIEVQTDFTELTEWVIELGEDRAAFQQVNS